MSSISNSTNDGDSAEIIEGDYTSDLLGHIHEQLTGLRGFDAMAREIIQNADDAGAREIRFSIECECLRVWNDAVFQDCGSKKKQCPWESEGRPSDGIKKVCDIHAISSVGKRSKYLDSSQIGRFGVGFVSVYQITDVPIIRSQKTQLQLNPADEKFNTSTISNLSGTEFELPWAFDKNSPLRKKLVDSPISPDDLDTVHKDLLSVATDCLLFLRKLKTITIVRGRRTTMKVEKRPIGSKDADTNVSQIQLSFTPGKRKEKWYVISASAKTEATKLYEDFSNLTTLAPKTDIQIAFKITDQKWTGKFFAFLPTEAKSPIPCHINADFFPESNRKALILSGQQHDRHWNEMLINVAANAVSQHLLQLREKFEHKQLWKLIAMAFDYKDDAHFGCFWEAISQEARGTNILLTSSNKWVSCEEAFVQSENLSKQQEQALSHISINLINRSLISHKDAISALGAQKLDLETVVDALEIWDEDQGDAEALKGKNALKKLLPALWTVTNSFITKSSNRPEEEATILDRLQRVRFAPSADGTIKAIDDLYKLPSKVKNKDVKRFIHNIPLVQETFGKYRNLNSLIDELSFNELLRNIESRVKDQESAATFFGSDVKDLKGFYKFLTTYPRGKESPEIAPIRKSPILRGHGRFLSPHEALLPGGFEDPVGKLDTLDLKYFDKKSLEFLTKILEVKPLTLETYVTDHMEEILAGELSSKQYKDLMSQLISHRKKLNKDEISSSLSELRLVKTMDGEMHRPRECYIKTEKLSKLIGNRPSLWVNNSAVFSASKKKEATEFFKQLGMRAEPSLEHICDRIDETVERSPTKRSQKAILDLLSYLSDVYKNEKSENGESAFESVIDRISGTEWLPASHNETLAWHAPHNIYQPIYASGFDSQVPVLKLNAKTPAQRRFLDFLGMPAIPETSVIVDHLNYCSSEDREPGQDTYKLLSKKFNDKDDLYSIQTLQDEECIYISEQRKYMSPERVFWNNPGLEGYCIQAPGWMREYKEMFEYLGVVDEPTAETYVSVLVAIANEYGYRSEKPPKDVLNIRRICLDKLAEEAGKASSNIKDILSDLDDEPFLLTVSGKLASAGDVALIDSNWFSEPFVDKLNDHLVEYDPDHDEILNHFELIPLSSVVTYKMINLGKLEPHKPAKDLICERRELLLCIFPKIRKDYRRQVIKALKSIKVYQTDHIEVKSIFNLSGEHIESDERKEKVHYDKADNELFIHTDLGDNIWTRALRAIFSTLIPGNENTDGMAGKVVMVAKSYDEAKDELKSAGYTQLPKETNDIETEDGGPIIEDEEVVDEDDPRPNGGDDNHENPDDPNGNTNPSGKRKKNDRKAKAKKKSKQPKPKGKVRPGPPRGKGYEVPEGTKNKPHELYILKLIGDIDAYLGKSAEGRAIIKIGLSSKTIEERKEEIQKSMPKGAFYWEIERTTCFDDKPRYPNHDIALKGEEAMKAYLADHAEHLNGEFYLAKEEDIREAWKSGGEAAQECEES